jgi:hypothetical protein
MYNEEKISAEFDATMEEAKERTGLKKKHVALLFLFEKLFRDEHYFESLKRSSILNLLFPVTLIYSDVLGYSQVIGPGAPQIKALHPSSTFSKEEKIKDVLCFCEYLLISPIMPIKGKKIEDSILICESHSHDFVKVALLNPRKEVGKRVSIREYYKEISNSDFCTFRKFYAPSELFLTNEKELFYFTREKLKEKFRNYEKRPLILYKLVNPFYETYSQFVHQQIKLLEEEFRKRLEYRI